MKDYIYYNDKVYYIGRYGYFVARHEDYMHINVWIAHNGPIPKGYVIHHKDYLTNTDNKTNNDIDNLQCMTRAEHASLHHKGKKGKKGIKWTDKQRAVIRNGRTSKYTDEEKRLRKNERNKTRPSRANSNITEEQRLKRVESVRICILNKKEAIVC